MKIYFLRKIIVYRPQQKSYILEGILDKVFGQFIRQNWNKWI